MRKIGLNYLIIAAFAISAAFTSCDKDNNNNNGNGNGNGIDNPVPDPEGTIMVAVRNSSNGNTWVYPDGCFGYHFQIWSDNNFVAGTVGTFATIGQISGLGNITKIPTSGWANRVAVKTGYGYVAKFEKSEWNPDTGQHEVVSTTYVRIYVEEAITSATTGGVIGFTIKYQSPFVP